MTATYCPWLGGGRQSAGGHCGRQTVSLAPRQQHTVHGWVEGVSQRDALRTANSIISSTTATYCPWLGGGSQSAGGYCGRQTVSLAPRQQHTVHGWVEGVSQRDALRTANSIISSMTATYCPRQGGGRQSAGGHCGRQTVFLAPRQQHTVHGWVEGISQQEGTVDGKQYP